MGPNIHFYDLKGLCEILEVWRLMGLSHIFGGLGLLFGREFVSFYFGLGLLHGFYFSNALSQPGQTNPTHYFLIKPMTNRFPNPSWTFSNTPLSLSLSLSLFQNSMAESFELCLLHSSPPPPPPTAVVLSFLSLTDPLSISLKPRPKCVELLHSKRHSHKRRWFPLQSS